MIPTSLLIRIGAVLALVLGLLFMGHRYIEGEREEARAEVRAEWAAHKAADKALADQIERNWRTKYDAAISQGAEREKTHRTHARAAAAAVDSLRDTNDQLQQRIATASTEAARAYATTYQTVFTECVRAYQGVAEQADGHANDVRTLTEAWPVKE